MTITQYLIMLFLLQGMGLLLLLQWKNNYGYILLWITLVGILLVISDIQINKIIKKVKRDEY